MSWHKINENLYSNDESSHVLAFENGLWVVRKTNYDSDRELSINDIVNNPIQPVLSIEPNTGLTITVDNDTVGIFDNKGFIGKKQILILEDSKPSGESSGTFTSGAWRTRALGTTPKINTIQGSSYNNVTSTITLPFGKYRAKGSTPAYIVSSHKAKLANITDGTDVVIGTSEYTHSNGLTSTRSFLDGFFEILETKDFQLQHRCLVTRATDGLGVPTSLGVLEIYTQLIIEKIL